MAAWCDSGTNWLAISYVFSSYSFSSSFLLCWWNKFLSFSLDNPDIRFSFPAKTPEFNFSLTLRFFSFFSSNYTITFVLLFIFVVVVVAFSLLRTWIRKCSLNVELLLFRSARCLTYRTSDGTYRSVHLFEVRAENQSRKLRDHFQWWRVSLKKIISKLNSIQFHQTPHSKNQHQHSINLDRCYSHVGRIGGEQKLSLHAGCQNFGTVLHEILHAVGFYHAHNRSDRDKYLRIHWRNIQQVQQHNFKLLSPEENLLFFPNKFDFNSVMLYGPTAFSKDGRSITMSPHDPRTKFTPVRVKTKLSREDVIAINLLYKCKKH